MTNDRLEKVASILPIAMSCLLILWLGRSFLSTNWSKLPDFSFSGGGEVESKSTNPAADKTSNDPVELFSTQVLNGILERAKDRHYLINEKGKWWYEKYDCKVSYDIRKTESLTSPLVALVTLDFGKTYPQYKDGNWWNTREELKNAPLQFRSTRGYNSDMKGPFTFAFQGKNWVYTPTERQGKYFGQPGDSSIMAAPWPISGKFPPREERKAGYTRISGHDEI